MTMKKTYRMQQLFAILVLPWCVAAGVHAQEEHHQDDPASTVPAAMSTGEVVKVDKALAKITLRHGPLDNLGMPGMTMAFRVGEPAMLDQVKPGDKVRFLAEMANGALTIVTLQTAN
jgi:Cu/Ag efflux protein CusF